MIARRVGNLRGIGLPRSPHRLALSPVCWGVSDVLGWGHQLDPERVLSEAAAVGEAAITAGPPGFLPDRSDQTRPLLKRHRLRVVAGEVHAILHHHDIRGAELAHIDGHAQWLSAIGAETLVLSAIPQRMGAAKHGIVLDNSEWAHLLHSIGSVQHVCARHKLKLAFQPMFGSTIQGPEDIERLLVGSDAGICLDLGHLMLAGADPLEVLELGVGRIQHVQLNDIDKDLAEQVRDQGEDYVEAVGMGLFKPLGEGIAKVDRVVEELRRSKYRGWYTLRQETRLPTADVRPLGGISRSLEYLLPLLS
ncbi:MAG TPA: sugar phosphate isomerase/epimerase [Candidatus Eisenbacteria bacterium]|nr:sugar phosphate isomerase/epimerase [Candidatus Eisenbacteria bacterium]